MLLSLVLALTIHHHVLQLPAIPQCYVMTYNKGTQVLAKLYVNDKFDTLLHNPTLPDRHGYLEFYTKTPVDLRFTKACKIVRLSP